MNICSKNVVVDYRIDKKAVETLKFYGFDVIFTKKADTLYEAVDGHTDLQLVKVHDELIAAPEFAEYYSCKLDKSVMPGTLNLKDKYPYDIHYNAAIFGNFCIHNFKFTDSVLMETIREKSLIEINTNQGYSKCSICIISDNAIITEDDNIYEAVKKYNIDVLKINKGSVKLNGLNYGFFGGATGIYNKTLYINGELKNHSDCDIIKKFCEKYDISIIELKKGDIIDIGSILFI